MCTAGIPSARVTSDDIPERVVPTSVFILTCSVPGFSHSGAVYYLWRTSACPPDSDTERSVTFRIKEDYPPLVRVFCHVIASRDNAYLTSGYIDIEIQGTYGLVSIPKKHFDTMIV